ncbi:U-box domain-containing protein 26-like isoform X2 [Alnus glutinosa]|uniref:U-box domain-containing protein 26-like isoform X2 n=1 Tax=Alnus glutinosa TaxID=3517 RepID=UPI002D76D286|nr:U-box domain-containing protein 26-like isoform X2 [Alnus glutinosa]
MKEADHMAIPHLFRCPISLDLFKDPVTLCTGQTYDRSSIEKWLAAGNLTCPVTMLKLHDPSIVPNHTLRHLIDQWLQMGHQLDPDYLATVDSLAALKQNLECHQATIQDKLQTLQKIRVLSEESPTANSCLIQLRFLPLLLELVFGKVKDKLVVSQDDHVKFVDQALSCVIRLLPFGELESLNMLKQESKLASFLDLFQHGTFMVKISLCHLIDAISSSTETKELCDMLGKTRQLLHEAALLVVGNGGSEASEAGIRALSALSSLESNRENLVAEGAVDGLVTYILGAERREKSLAPMAMATLEKLLETSTSAKEALVNNPNGVNAIVRMVFRVSDHDGSESAVSLLTIICSDSLRAREEAIAAGVLTQLLLLLQSQCNGRTKTKARMLLKLLRSKWVEDSKHDDV